MGTLQPFITGVPESTLGLPREPDQLKRSVSVWISSPTVTGSVSLINPALDLKYKSNVVDSVTIKGEISEAGGPGYVLHTYTLKKNGVSISTLTKFYEWGAAIDEDFLISETFELYQPILVERSDVLTVDIDISNVLEWDSTNFTSLSIDGRSFY